MSGFLFLDTELVKDKQRLKTTDLCQVLPNLLFSLALGLPLLTDNLRNVRVIEARIAGNYGLLVVLPIKNKCYRLCQLSKTFADKGGGPLFLSSHPTQSRLGGTRDKERVRTYRVLGAVSWVLVGRDRRGLRSLETQLKLHLEELYHLANILARRPLGSRPPLPAMQVFSCSIVVK